MSISYHTTSHHHRIHWPQWQWHMIENLEETSIGVASRWLLGVDQHYQNTVHSQLQFFSSYIWCVTLVWRLGQALPPVLLVLLLLLVLFSGLSLSFRAVPSPHLFMPSNNFTTPCTQHNTGISIIRKW